MPSPKDLRSFENQNLLPILKIERKRFATIYRLAERSEVSKVKEITESDEFFEEAIKPGLYEYEDDCPLKTNQSEPCEEKAEKSYLSDGFIAFLPVYNELAGKLRYPISEQIIKIRYQALSVCRCSFLAEAGVLG